MRAHRFLPVSTTMGPMPLRTYSPLEREHARVANGVPIRQIMRISTYMAMGLVVLWGYGGYSAILVLMVTYSGLRADSLRYVLGRDLHRPMRPQGKMISTPQLTHTLDEMEALLACLLFGQGTSSTPTGQVAYLLGNRPMGYGAMGPDCLRKYHAKLFMPIGEKRIGTRFA